MKTEILSIGIVDDHTLFRSGLANLLSEFDEIKVIFEAKNGIDMQKQLQLNPNVQLVLMDINMPIMDGYAATRYVKKEHPHINVLALSMHEDENAIIGMLKAGAGGYVLKGSTPAELVSAIKALIDKGFYINEMVSGRLLFSLKQDEPKPLITEKELTFLQHCSTEFTYKEIADLMNISPRTVDNYRESLFAKLNIKTRTGLVVYGIKHNLIKI